MQSISSLSYLEVRPLIRGQTSNQMYTFKTFTMGNILSTKAQFAEYSKPAMNLSLDQIFVPWLIFWEDPGFHIYWESKNVKHLIESGVLQVFPKLYHFIPAKTLLEISTLQLKEFRDFLKVTYICASIYNLPMYLSMYYLPVCQLSIHRCSAIWKPGFSDCQHVLFLCLFFSTCEW